MPFVAVIGKDILPPPFAVHKAYRRTAIRGRYPIRDVAEAHENRIILAFLRTIEAIKRSIRLAEIEELIRNHDFSGVEQLIDPEYRLMETLRGKGLSAGETSLMEALQDTFRAGASAELDKLKDLLVEKAARRPKLGMELQLNLMNPEAVAFLEGYAFNLIRGLGQEARETIRDIIVTAFREGGHPYAQAREIRNAIGLTPRQAQAVHNFRRRLETGDVVDMKEALQRALRDRRFDPTLMRAISEQKRLPQGKIDQMADRYYSRYLKYRAETIARTESLRASHMGQRELWRQATGQGLLKPERTRREWIITPDEKLCSLCEQIPGMNPDGVPLGESFATSIGPVDGPPAHVSCRCSEGLHFLPRK